MGAPAVVQDVDWAALQARYDSDSDADEATTLAPSAPPHSAAAARGSEAQSKPTSTNQPGAAIKVSTAAQEGSAPGAKAATEQIGDGSDYDEYEDEYDEEDEEELAAALEWADMREGALMTSPQLATEQAALRTHHAPSLAKDGSALLAAGL